LFGCHGYDGAFADGGVHFLQKLLYGVAERAVDGSVVLEVRVRAVIINVLGHVAERHDKRGAKERELLVGVGVVEVLVEELAEFHAPAVDIEQNTENVGEEFRLVLRRNEFAAHSHADLRLAELRFAVVARERVLKNGIKPRISRDRFHKVGNFTLAEKVFRFAHYVASVDKRLYRLVAIGVSGSVVDHNVNHRPFVEFTEYFSTVFGIAQQKRRW